MRLLARKGCSSECLILDQHLPGVTGLDFLSSVGGPLPHLPVILITGRGDRAIRDRAAQARRQRRLGKPIGDGILMAAIHRALDHREDCKPELVPTH